MPPPPAKADPNATSAPKVQESVIDNAREMQVLAEETQANIFNDNVKNAYYKFRINPTNANAEAFYNTSIHNIETAIAAEQKAGADFSALKELKGKMESAKSVAVEQQTDAGAQARRAATERNMTKAVSALANLPAGLQATADAYAARQALYDYMKADEGGKAAAYDKATKVLKGSISSALANGTLDTRTRHTLEGMLDNIDSRGEMGDNNKQSTSVGSKSSKPVSKRQQYMGRTPSKLSQTGNAVIERMSSEGKIRIDDDGTHFQASNSKWYTLSEADMAHKIDAVRWWNEIGRRYGAKSKEVLQFMLDPDNYYLEYYRINRSQGARLGETYLSPLVEEGTNGINK